MKRGIVVGILALLCAARSPAQEAVVEAMPASAVQARPFTHAVVVSGIQLDPEEQQRKDRAVLQLQQLLVRDLGLPAGNLIVLADEQSLVRDKTESSTATSLKRALEEAARRADSSSVVLFYYVGQANIVKGGLRLNFRGADVSQEDLAAWLLGVKPGLMAIVLDCPGAGLMLGPLAGADRILICGARGDQPYATRFSDFFVPALHSLDADYSGDGITTLLEAFRYASEHVEQAYNDASLKKTENALLEDNGDGLPAQRPWTYVSEAEDGGRAAALAVYAEANAAYE